MTSTSPHNKRYKAGVSGVLKQGLDLLNRDIRHLGHRSPAGSAPGTITINPTASQPKLDVMLFSPSAPSTSIYRQPLAALDDLTDSVLNSSFCWLNVVGLGDASVLEAIGKRFGIHALTLEDIAHTAQRPKIESFDHYVYIVTRIPEGDGSVADLQSHSLSTEQLSICVGQRFVLTFQETAKDMFEPVRNRLINGPTMKARGTDYLAYALLDAAIDAFFPLLEWYGEQLESLESEVIQKAVPQQMAAIHDLKRNLLTCRRAIWPQREMLNALMREESALVSDHTKLFLRDCYDHTVQLMDAIETHREIATGLVDILLSSQSNKMNEIMKVLTIIATIFIPLSFVAGVYGMNFNTDSPWNMPELQWRYGYLIVWLIMLTMASGLLFWFWRKGWIGSRND